MFIKNVSISNESRGCESEKVDFISEPLQTVPALRVIGIVLKILRFGVFPLSSYDSNRNARGYDNQDSLDTLHVVRFVA